MRLAVPDLVSNSYFPAIAAVELGMMRQEGLDVELELLYPVTDAARALRDGRIDLLAGAAHAPLHAFPDWSGAKLLSALSMNTYWFLVVRSDHPLQRGDSLASLRDMRIGAAPGPDLALFRLLEVSDVDIAEARLQIGPITGGEDKTESFGVSAARALAEGRVDAFWANGMGAEVAVRSGAGRVIVDARRDGRPGSAFTFPALMATDRMIENEPEALGAAVRAVAKTQIALTADPTRAERVGRQLFPPMEADLIAELVARDTPFYQSVIDEGVVRDLNSFSQRSGLLSAEVPYEAVVTTTFASFWST